MIFSYRCGKIIQSKNFVNKFMSSMCCYFSAGKSNFIKNARALDKLKLEPSFPQSAYEHGKYILLVESSMVCIEENDKLLWKDYKGVTDINKQAANPLTVILDVITDADSNVCLFAVDYQIESDDDLKQLEDKLGGKFISARKSLFLLDEKESQYVTKAKGLANFCRSTNFCAGCGHSLVFKSAGTTKHCENCKRNFYPAISPVGITLIEDELHSKVLLVRQSRHPLGMYSCVAGFIEPGESLEQNIQREVAEEVGMELECVEYIASQHWAMPMSQLMLGCIATAIGEDFEKDDFEIEDAKWVSAEELRNAVERVKKSKNLADVSTEELWVPPPSAVAHHLMALWLQKYHGYTSPIKSHI